MNPETDNLIKNTIGNPAGITPSIPPSQPRLTRIINALRNRKKLVLSAVAAIFLIGVIILMAIPFIQKRFFPETKPFEIFNTPPSAQIQNAPSIFIKTKGKKNFSLNEKIAFTAIANSRGQEVTGFDVYIKFDPEFLTLDEKKSPTLKDFQYYGSIKDNIFQSSAVRKPDSTTPQIFKDQMLFEFEFTPKKAGKTDLTIIYSPNSTSDSNLINKESDDILGNAQGVEITIE